MRERALIGASLCAIGLVLGARSARAQPHPEDVQAAAAAFDQGQRAQLRGEWARAADLFELADRSAPSPPALRSAIRNRRQAGQMARAATLAMQARVRYPDDPETVALADEVLGAARAALGRIAIVCTPACSLALDGRAIQERAQESFEVFVEPGACTIAASWPGRQGVTREVSLTAGGEASIVLEAPALPEPQSVPEPDPADEPALAPEPAPAPGRAPGPGRIHVAIFGTGLALTALALALGIGFGMDVLSKNDAYVAMPTRARYEEGVERQWIANTMFASAAALGIATLVIAFLTDWDGEQALAPTVALAEDGAWLGIGGRL